MNHAPCTVVSYIPALHRGYIDFFKKYQGGILYILGGEFIKEVPRMDRDIRALVPEEIRTLVASLNSFSRVEILDYKNLAKLQAGSEKIVMPDEDFNRNFAETYLKGKKIEFVTTFLRWDKQISTKEFEVTPDRTISTDTFDKEIMDAAFKESGKSPDWWRQVGGIIVKDKKPILKTYNKPFPSDTFNIFGDPRSNFDAGQNIELSKIIHAEVGLIAEAARKGISIEGSSLYVTTFPCPVCARSVATAGIKKVYYSKGYSLLDAEDILRAFEIEIIMVK